MPIYAYKCESCGFAKDVLQKISDDPLKDCPACAKPSFVKQLTAAGFQLKGSGWYATDFKGGNSSAAPAGDSVAPAVAPTTKADSATPAAAPAATASTPATPADGA